MFRKRLSTFGTFKIVTIKERLILLVAFVCILVLMTSHFFHCKLNKPNTSCHVCFLATNFNKYRPSILRNIGFTALEYEQALLQETTINDQYGLTAILLHWQRFDGLNKTLHQLLYTNLFKQIIIWNNNPDINLTLHRFNNQTHSHMTLVRIINSQQNLKDVAKYRACAEAKTRACFYVDDDYTPAHYLKSLIASFRADPDVLHSVTDPYTYYTNLVWSYFDSTIDLHTGFAWIGCGSVFLRQHAQHHLQLMDKYLWNHTDLSGLADVFFSVWLNSIPVQLNTILREESSSFPSLITSFSSTPNFLLFQYTSSVLAIRTLEQSLRLDRSKDENVAFSRRQDRRFPSYVKSPSLNDDFIFYTNVLPFELETVPFNISRDFERGTRNNLPSGPNISRIVDYSTAHAVDTDAGTCWHTHREIRSNDFFAIDFLSIQSTVMFTIAVGYNHSLQSALQVKISFDGVVWSTYESTNGIYKKTNRTVGQPLNTYLFDSSEFNHGFRSFRYISFKANRDWDNRFQVCEVKAISKERITDIKLDFRQ